MSDSGNGRQNMMVNRLTTVLGPQWKLECVIELGPRQPGYPTCYKVDLGWPEKKLAIEVDGPGHSAFNQRIKDIKKDARLTELGWSVLRIRHSMIRSMFMI
jgi:hypothetical protein